MSTKRKRITAAVCFAALLGVEILIGRFAHGFVRAYIGDVLVIPLLYCFVRVFYVRRSVWLPAAVGSLGILGIPRGILLGILLGSSADWGDMLCYAAGTALIYLTEYCFFFYSDKKREKPC